MRSPPKAQQAFDMGLKLSLGRRSDDNIVDGMPDRRIAAPDIPAPAKEKYGQMPGPLLFTPVSEVFLVPGEARSVDDTKVERFLDRAAGMFGNQMVSGEPGV